MSVKLKLRKYFKNYAFGSLNKWSYEIILKSAANKFVRERIAGRSWEKVYPNFQALNVAAINAELSETVTAKTQKAIKDCWLAIKGDGIEDEAKQLSVQERCRTAIHQWKSYVSVYHCCQFRFNLV